MTVSVLRRPNQDRTNGGVSGRHDRLPVVSKGDKPPVAPAFPVMVLELHAPGEVCLRPLEGGPDGHVGPVSGGNYAAADGTFNNAVEKLLGSKFHGAVAVHDRFESHELYDTLH